MAENAKERALKKLQAVRDRVAAQEEVKKKRGPNKGEGGAPWKLTEDDMIELYTMASIGCTVSEIAERLNVPVKTIESNQTYQGIIKEGKENFKSSLRRMQYASARDGNVSMQIWLGKQILGQKDKIENDTKISNPLLDRALKMGLSSNNNLVKARDEDAKFEEVEELKKLSNEK